MLAISAILLAFGLVALGAQAKVLRIPAESPQKKHFQASMKIADLIPHEIPGNEPLGVLEGVPRSPEFTVTGTVVAEEALVARSVSPSEFRQPRSPPVFPA